LRARALYRTLQKTLFLWLILLAWGGAILEAQQANTLYLMHFVPQTNLLNPAVQIQCKYYIGIPVLSSIHLNYSNTAFTYNNLASTNTWDIEGVSRQMHRRDLYTGEAQMNLLAFGYKHKSLYFTFNLTERAKVYQTVPGEMAQMAVNGNGPSLGETARFDGFRPGGYHTRNYSLGVSKVFGPYLTAGVRAKLLFGKANLTTGSSKIRVNTQEDNFALLMEGDYTLNASFPMTITKDDEGNITGVEVPEIDPVVYMMNRGNVGFGLDFGLIYRYTEKITLSASVLDLALVRWKTDLNNVRGTGDFEYAGTDLSQELSTGTLFDEIVDSIFNSTDATTSLDPYSYFLPTQIFLAGSYQYSEKISFGLVNRNVIYKSKLHSSFTLSAQATLARKFTSSVSWSYLNNSLANLGVGIAWHGKGIQFHAVTDNLMGYFFPFDTRTLNLRLGMNLMLGCPRNKREKLKLESYGFLPNGGDCPYPERPEKSLRKRKKIVRRINKI
jgi:hypothetical protein